MPMNHQQISEWCLAGGVSPFSPENVNPASLDLRWSGQVKFDSVTGTGWSSNYDATKISLLRNEIYLLDTLEYIKMPLDYCGLILSKTKLGRGGTELGHVGWVDPGFEGTITFQLIHFSRTHRTIEQNDRLIQLVLLKLDEATAVSYKEVGNYDGQHGPTGTCV